MRLDDEQMSPMGSTSPITVNDPRAAVDQHVRARAVLDARDAVRLARHQIQRAQHRRPERRLEEVIAHREPLRVVPDRGHRVAVEIREVQRLVRLAARRLPSRRDELADGRRKQIHLAVVVRDLLLRVAVILIGRRRLRRGQTVRIHRVGAVRRIREVRIRRQQRRPRGRRPPACPAAA